MQSLSAFKSPGERVFLFSWERLGWSLWETFVSRKAVPEVLDVKYRSEVKHGYTNRGYLHCVILKPLHCFKENRAHKARDMQVLLQNV